MTSYIISLTLLAASVAILRTLFRKNVSAKLVYAMWLAVVLRLCLPFDLILLDVPTPEHFLGDMLNTKLEETDAATEKAPTFVTPSTEQIGSITTGGIGENVLPETGGKPSVDVNTGALVSPVIPDAPPSVESRPIADNSVMEDLPSVSEPAYELPSLPETPEASVPARDSAVKLPIKQMAAVLWIVGSGVTLGVFCISWLVFKVKLLGSRRFYGTCGRTKVYVSDRITSPCAFGVIPRIYITPEAESSPHLSVILLHEKTHIAHFDHLWNMVRVAAVAAHWWNPVIWLCAVLSKRDAELACDEDVTKQLDPKERLEYAKLIVDMIPVKKNCAVSFAGGPIKERIMKLTKEHKNKIIIAVVAVLLVACSLVIAFIGAKDDSTDIPATSDTATETPETTEDAETTEVPESSAEPDTEPVPVYGSFKVLEATEENISSFEALKEYDVSSSEYSFSLILVSEADVTDLNITRLTWNEELLVEGEEIMENIGEVKAGEAILLTTDSVEIIGYTGISYTKDGETVRYYPATSGKDGSAILVEIGREMLTLDMLYHGLPRYEVTLSADMSLAKLISELPRDIDKQTGFYYDEHKVLTVYGLAVPVYIEFGKYYKTRSFAAYGKIAYNTGTWGETNYGSVYELSEYNGAVIISCDYYDMYVNTAVFTPEEVSVFDSESGVSTNIEINGDDLVYERVSVKFKRPVTQTATAPLDLAVSRDEFFKETGVARIENGKLVLEKPDESFAIGEVYDLDALFEDYKLNYLGYESADEVLERNRKRESGEEEPLTNQPVIPDESYVGNWNDLLDGIDIWEITEDTIKFSSGQFRLFGFDGMATLTDGKWIFVEDNDYVTDEEKIRGRLEFTDTSVSVIYDTDGRYDYIKSGHTNTFVRHIVKSEEGREYSGLIHRCYGQNGYGNPYLGFYTLTFVPVDESYSVIEELKICNGGCEQSDGSPIAEYGVEDGWQYPVKVYDTKFDESLKDTYPTEYIDSKRTAMYVFDIGDGMHFKLTITRFDSKNFNNLLENEQELLDKIAKCCRLEYTLLDGKTGEVGYNSGIKTAEVSAEHLAQAETDIRYKWITSFIGKDIDGCVEVLASNWYSIDKEKCKKIMAPLEGVYFDNYRVSEIEDDDPTAQDKLLLEFEVVKSNCDVYPVGRYKAEVSTGMMFNFYVHFIERPGITKQTVLDKYEYELGVADYLFETAYNITFPDDPYSDDWGWRCMSENLVIAYMNVNNTQYGEDVKFTKAELLELAKELYGVENYKIHEDAFTEKDGIYRVNGHGGVGMKLDIVGITDENGIFAVDMRYYTDIAEFGEAFVVRYTFERSESVYGLRLVKIEKIKDNGYDNWGYVV